MEIEIRDKLTYTSTSGSSIKHVVEVIGEYNSETGQAMCRVLSSSDNTYNYGETATWTVGKPAGNIGGWKITKEEKLPNLIEDLTLLEKKLKKS